MRKIVCIIFIFMVSRPAEAQSVTRTYVFRHLSDKNAMLADYIQLVFENDSVISGTYFGNEDDAHYKAEIKFEEPIEQNNTRYFSVSNFAFSKKMATPFEDIKYLPATESKGIPIHLEYPINFFGTISNEKLDLHRTLTSYHSRADEMPFVLEKTE